MKPSILFSFRLLTTLIAGDRAWAHGIQIKTSLSRAVEVKAQFEDSRPMKQAEIKICEPQDPEHPTFVGRTDNQGLYHFVPTMAGDWEIVVRQTGHGAQAVLPVQMDGNQHPQIATTQTRQSWMQRIITIGATLWSCVGTALYLKRRTAQ